MIYDWNIELKYPEQVHKNIKKYKYIFLNREGTQLKVAIVESATTDKDIQSGEHGKRVKINNLNGVFHPLTPTKRIKVVQSRQLMWLQNGTMIELFSPINIKIIKKRICMSFDMHILFFIYKLIHQALLHKTIPLFLYLLKMSMLVNKNHKEHL